MRPNSLLQPGYRPTGKIPLLEWACEQSLETGLLPANQLSQNKKFFLLASRCSAKTKVIAYFCLIIILVFKKMIQLFLKFWPITPAHILLVHTDTISVKLSRRSSFFGCSLMETWTIDVCEERSQSLCVPQSPISQIVTGTCTP